MSGQAGWPHREAGAPGASDDPAVDEDASEPNLGDDAGSAPESADDQLGERDAPPADA